MRMYDVMDDEAPNKKHREVLDGPLLSERDKLKLKRRKRKDERQREIFQALVYLNNVIFDELGVAKITDFGLSKIMEEDVGSQGMHLHLRELKHIGGGGVLPVPYGMGGMLPRDAAPSQPMPITALASALANAPADQQRTMLGENLYPLVDQLEHDHSAKVTGMPFEMDQTEVLHLLESPDALKAKSYICFTSTCEHIPSPIEHMFLFDCLIFN